MRGIGEPTGELTGYKEEHEMREKVDRELVLAGLTGIFERGEKTDKFVQEYSITELEQKRAAKTAIQGLLGKLDAPAFEKDARTRIDQIARQFRVTKDEIESLAWEVVRGALDDTEGGEEYQLTGMKVFKEYLRKQIPKGASFSYTGEFDAFQPSDKSEMMHRVVSDLVVGGLGGNDKLEDMPSELQQLIRDLGMDK